ncbi:MAG: hypothetical protein EOM76_10150, partial [Sphingobacteriia bacterium]|nr:hypothetical protein [Sphingobacteriia bacterium]
MRTLIFFAFCFGCLIFGIHNSYSQSYILKSEAYKHYIDSFNANDNELYKEYFPNDKCWEFLSTNIPLFDCPDKLIEQTYYFRWWTYRKHIKKTPDGFVITEFLPDVPWAGKYNGISCPAALHFYEGRWLHDQKYLNDYARYWFRGGGSIRTYSFWAADALYNQFQVTNDSALIKDLLPDMINNYEAWEKEKLDSNGLFWQIDNYDGMEVSICGSGYRATINSYMFGDAIAISKMASILGEKEISKRYKNKATDIKQIFQNNLWDNKDSFFKVLPREPSAILCITRELHGYTPWCFNMPDNDEKVILFNLKLKQFKGSENIIIEFLPHMEKFSHADVERAAVSVMKQCILDGRRMYTKMDVEQAVLQQEKLVFLRKTEYL